MRHEVGHGHLARDHKGDEAGEESEHQQKAADQLKPCGNRHERRQSVHPHAVIRRREVKELLGAVLEKEQPDDDAKKAEEDRFPTLQR